MHYSIKCTAVYGFALTLGFKVQLCACAVFHYTDRQCSAEGKTLSVHHMGRFHMTDRLVVMC